MSAVDVVGECRHCGRRRMDTLHQRDVYPGTGSAAPARPNPAFNHHFEGTALYRLDQSIMRTTWWAQLLDRHSLGMKRSRLGHEVDKVRRAA